MRRAPGVGDNERKRVRRTSPLIARTGTSSDESPRESERRAPPVIQLREATRTYELGSIKVRALREVSLRIERGDFIAIMGSSGSGKSTLMNILGCLDAPTGGRYLLDGVDAAQMDEDDLSDLRNRKIGRASCRERVFSSV